mgnify:FL=1
MRMKAVTPNSHINREKRQWWVVADNHVIKCTGYSCAPNNPEVWWLPEVGFSGAEGDHLFKTEDEALAKAIKEIECNMLVIQERLSILKQRKQNINNGD